MVQAAASTCLLIILLLDSDMAFFNIPPPKNLLVAKRKFPLVQPPLFITTTRCVMFLVLALQEIIALPLSTEAYKLDLCHAY